MSRVDVLAFLDPDIRDPHSGAIVAHDAEIAEVRAAVAELIEAAETTDLWSPDKATRVAARRRLTAALARIGGAA